MAADPPVRPDQSLEERVAEVFKVHAATYPHQGAAREVIALVRGQVAREIEALPGSAMAGLKYVSKAHAAQIARQGDQQ